ncbi:hypothetical protein WKI40_14820 [Kosakonia sacchari]|uniref:hypothetical protein n=1 Tax=Kosakonia sacchari TaxID=1158459 RepID=UPI0030C1B7DE
MSIEKIKKLEDLKAEEKKIFEQRNKLFDKQRPDAINALLNEMAVYLKDNGFSNAFVHEEDQRSFTSSYGEILITVTSSKDSESFLGADYQINISSGKKSASISLSLNRGDRVQSPHEGNLDAKIHDYETRYLPALRALDIKQLDGSYSLTFNSMLLKTPKSIPNGRTGMDMFFDLLSN